ncbi:MAG: aminoglycoside phosphotransferase [Actinomycetes bacterium]
MNRSLDALVASASGEIVVAEGSRRAAIHVAVPLRLLDSLDLGDGRYLAVVQDGTGYRWTTPLIRSADTIRRAHPGDGVAEALVSLIARQSTIDSEAGGFLLTSWTTETPHGERGIAADQTNESLVVGERAIVKWSIRLADDDTSGHPAPQRISALVQAGFGDIPRPLGMVQWRANALATPALIADVAAFLEGAVDGWQWAVADVTSLARNEIDMNSAVQPAKKIGALTARLHVALAKSGQEDADSRRVSEWKGRALADLAEAVAIVDGPEGQRLSARALAIAESYDSFDEVIGTPLIDIHGDFHVGQILRYGEPHEYAVTDFDGNPVLPPYERVQRMPAALDIAGMLAALDHVGRIVLKRIVEADDRLVRTWIAAAQAAFYDEYIDTLTTLGAADLFDARLIAPFRLQQEVREFLYAVKHLPLWRYVPDGALADLIPDPATNTE